MRIRIRLGAQQPSLERTLPSVLPVVAGTRVERTPATKSPC